MAWFKKNNKPKRVKVELIKKLEYNQYKKPSTDSLIRWGSIGFMAIMIISSIIVGFIYNNQAVKVSNQIVELEKKVDKIKDEIVLLHDKSAMTDKEIEAVANSATNAGRAVADLQNRYRRLDVKTQVDEIHQTAEELGKYMDKDSENERVVWFSRYDTQKELTWKFMSTYSFTGDTMKVVWECVDSDGTIYAYATGVYNVKTTKFSEVKHALTSIGGQMVNATVENENKTHLDQLIKDIREKTKDKSSESKFDPKTKDDIDKAREALRKEQNE